MWDFSLAREELEEILYSVADAVTVSDRDGNLVFANPAAARILGYATPDELCGQLGPSVTARYDLFDEAGRPMPPEALPNRRAMCGERHPEAVIRSVERATGIERWSLTRSTRLVDEQGRLRMVVSFFAEFTDRKRAEQERDRLLLREREVSAAAEIAERRIALLYKVTSGLNEAPLDDIARLAKLPQLIVPELADHCLVAVYDKDGKERPVSVAHVDPAKAERTWELFRRWPRARKREFELPLERPFLLAEVPDSAWVNAAHDEEHLAMLRSFGTHSMMIVPLVLNEQPLGLFHLGISESNRRYGPADLALACELANRTAVAVENARLYEQAQREIRSRADLLAVVSHDLKSPLGAVLLNLGVLLERSPEPLGERTRAALANMQRSATRMNQLIRDLLDMDGIEAGHLQVTVKREDVGALLDEVVLLHHLDIADKGLHLERTFGQEGLAVRCDRKRVLQIYANLIGNALKFTADGAITLGAERHGADVHFWVGDSGRGISDADRPHVFERFWRSAAASDGGNGLGLYIVKGIVDAHGGRIAVESRREPGSGTTVHFYLHLDGDAALE